MRITVNPDVPSTGGFPVWAPGQYRLRITGLEEQTAKSGAAMLNVTHEPVDAVLDQKGGAIATAGKLFNRVLIEPVRSKDGERSFSFLRALVEGAGLDWQDFDTDELLGKEVLAHVKITQFEGNERNEIGRYIKA